jgi:hypothetical protein
MLMSIIARYLNPAGTLLEQVRPLSIFRIERERHGHAAGLAFGAVKIIADFWMISRYIRHQSRS